MKCQLTAGTSKDINIINTFTPELLIELAPLLPSFVEHNDYQIIAPNTTKNPLSQYYVFYSDKDQNTTVTGTNTNTTISSSSLTANNYSNNITNNNNNTSNNYSQNSAVQPKIFVSEFCLEPRLAFKPSLLFLEQTLYTLLNSHLAWLY